MAIAKKSKLLKIESDIIYFEVNNQIFKAKIQQNSCNSQVYIFNFNKSFVINNNNPTKIIPAIKTDLENKFENILKSPLSGRIIKINVKPNEFVRKNQVLLTIESMKMENEIRAQGDAFIKTISIKQGDLVQLGQVLVTFEKKGELNATSKNKNEQTEISNR